MRMLCGLTHPTGWACHDRGADAWKDRQNVRTKFGYVPQRFSLYRDLTVLENFRFFGGAYGVPRAQVEGRIDRLLRVDRFAGETLCHRCAKFIRRDASVVGDWLRGGPQSVAAVFRRAHRGLDPIHRQQIWNLLYDLSNEGKTIFVTTHYMDEAERCTEVGFIENGRLLAKASPRALKSSFCARLLEIDVEPLMPALVRLRKCPSCSGFPCAAAACAFTHRNQRRLMARWHETWPFPDIRLLGERWVEPDMEDVFTAYRKVTTGF